MAHAYEPDDIVQNWANIWLQSLRDYAVIGLSVAYKAFDNLGGFKTLFGVQPDNRVAVLAFGLHRGLIEVVAVVAALGIALRLLVGA